MDSLRAVKSVADWRWCGAHGIGRHAAEMRRRMPDAGALPIRGGPLHPLDPASVSAALWRRRPAVYYSPGFNPPLWSPCPFVFTIHDLIHLRVPQETSLSKRLYYDLVVKPACRRASFVCTQSEASRADICNWAGIPLERIVVTGCGVSAVFTATGEKYQPGFEYILYVGNQKPHKNVPRLLEAFAASRARRFVKLLGTGHLTAETRALAEKLSIARDVVSLGILSDEALASVYRGAALLVMPSLYEGWGLPVAEAMACGTPVVTSLCTSIPEVAGDAVHYVDERDVDCIREGIDVALEDSELRVRLIERGLSRARLHSWDRVAELVREAVGNAAGLPARDSVPALTGVR